MMMLLQLTCQYKCDGSEDAATQPEHDAGEYDVRRGRTGRRRSRPQELSTDGGSRGLRNAVNPHLAGISTTWSVVDRVRRWVLVFRRRS